MPGKPLLLWFDFSSEAPDVELRVQCAQSFVIEYASHVDEGAAVIRRSWPKVLVFDFDRPDQQRLRAMQSIKGRYPKLPVLMLTRDHSEALAVWAFRARVWNYLVKPVAPAEFAENLSALARIARSASPPRAAQLLQADVPEELPSRPVQAAVGRLQPALDFVKNHLHEKVPESAAARACSMTRFEFSRKFHAAFGVTFRSYLLHLRIAEARRLLIEGGRSVTEVAYMVGYNDGSHFARMFKRHTGLLPSQYHAAHPPAPGGGHGPADVPPDRTPRRRATDLR
jgi:AraC-like DNA-binding protein